MAFSSLLRARVLLYSSEMTATNLLGKPHAIHGPNSVQQRLRYLGHGCTDAFDLHHLRQRTKFVALPAQS